MFLVYKVFVVYKVYKVIYFVISSAAPSAQLWRAGPCVELRSSCRGHFRAFVEEFLEKIWFLSIIYTMRKLALVLVLAIGITAAINCGGGTAYKKIRIRGQVFKIEIADNDAARARGLGYRASLPRDCGMLFVFERKERHTFWMKGMRFPLDFLWIDGTKVADITQKVPAPSVLAEKLPVYAPRVAVDKVLELNAGVVKKFGIAIGDTVSFLK